MDTLQKRSGAGSISRCKPLLGTFVEITISGDLEDKNLVLMTNNAFGEIERIEKMMSYYDDSSEVSFLNREANKRPCKVSGDLINVLKRAKEIGDLSNGLFDVTVARLLVKQKLLTKKYSFLDNSSSYKDISIMGDLVSFSKKLAIDLGGIAKGYAVDMAMRVFEKFPDLDVVINAGGDLSMNIPSGKFVDIKCSKDSSCFAKMPMYRRSLASSANYYQKRNKSAIINPNNKEAATEDKIISVFADDCVVADALTKVAFLTSDLEEMLKKYSAKAFEMNSKGEVMRAYA